ncbi:MAG: hypothetical protein A2X36_10915 [Elusimicrobia bacterium GWA2_69_24]|nr:MAG: hypothetical protein A2X36_10915 [Elusimicrobia bacterium GWA2_69_24]HBL18356.1 hypothetical protein [Elusimicrobiota bacterium]
MKLSCVLSAVVALSVPGSLRAEMESEALLRSFDAHSQGVSAVAVSPAGDYFASGGRDGKVRAWTAADYQQTLEAAPSTQPVLGAAISKDGTVAAFADAAGTLSFYSTFKGALLGQTTGLAGISFIDFSVDGRSLLVGVRSGELRSFSATDFRPGKPIRSDSKSPVTALRYAKDRLHFVTGHADGTLQYWSGSLGKVLKAFPAHGAPVLGIAFTPDGKYFCSAGRDGGLKFWSAEGELKKEARGASAVSVAFPEKLNLAVLGGTDGALHVLRLPQGEAALTTAVGPGPVIAAFLPEDRLLVTGDGGGKVKVWRNPLVYRQYKVLLDLGDKAFAAGRYDMAVTKFGEAASLFAEPEVAEKMKLAREKKLSQQQEQLKKMRDLQQQTRDRMRGSNPR